MIYVYIYICIYVIAPEMCLKEPMRNRLQKMGFPHGFIVPSKRLKGDPNQIAGWFIEENPI